MRQLLAGDNERRLSDIVEGLRLDINSVGYWISGLDVKRLSSKAKALSSIPGFEFTDTHCRGVSYIFMFNKFEI